MVYIILFEFIQQHTKTKNKEFDIGKRKPCGF